MYICVFKQKRNRVPFRMRAHIPTQKQVNPSKEILYFYHGYPTWWKSEERKADIITTLKCRRKIREAQYDKRVEVYEKVVNLVQTSLNM